MARQSETVKNTVWDVIDRVIRTSPEAKGRKEFPNASTVDTISCVDCAIVLYDWRVDEPIYYALHAEHPTARGLSRIANISKLRIRVMCIS